MPQGTRAGHTQHAYESHPSLAASLEDFETPMTERPSPLFNIPSTHSGFRAQDEDSEHDSSTDSAGPWSPPAWRAKPSGWFANANLAAAAEAAGRSTSQSRESSPAKDDADITLQPANVPLPGSPSKGSSRRNSPEPAVPPDDETPTPSPEPDDVSTPRENYYRFSARFDVQQRTETLEEAVATVRNFASWIVNSKANLLSSAILLIACWMAYVNLIRAPEQGPGPDLIKVAGLAKSFEPLIHYSENGVQQIGDLQETGVAVWDLGESVRMSNMTSAPIIVRELDHLSDSLKTLAIELTRFFANVDGDVDSILIVMEWAKRELTQISSSAPGRVGSILENVSLIAQKFGGTTLSQVITTFMGATHAQLTRSTLQRTFTEFLNVLEESINNELQYSVSLFALFEAIDRQFLNLQRSVMRETDSQEVERAEENVLAALWRWAINDKSRVHKYEKNLALLANVKARTVQNKLVLVDHNGKLLKLKSNLEILRKRLVSPLVRSNESSTLSVEEQIGGLEGTYAYLQAAREQQKSKMMERLYGAGSRRSGVHDGRLVDGR